MKKLMLFSMLLFFAAILESQAQISAGVYRLSSATFASIGTDPDNKIFGEARVSTGGNVGIEGTFGYNFVQKEDVNFYSGFHLDFIQANKSASAACKIMPAMCMTPLSVAAWFYELMN